MSIVKKHFDMEKVKEIFESYQTFSVEQDFDQLQRVVQDAQDFVKKAAREIDGAQGDAEEFARIYSKQYNEPDAERILSQVAKDLKKNYDHMIDMAENLQRIASRLRV